MLFVEHKIHSVNPPPPLFIGGFRFLKNHRREDQDFLVKMGGSPYREGSIEGERKHRFSLIRYEFCRSKDALFSASLLYRMFIFVLTGFDI